MSFFFLELNSSKPASVFKFDMPQHALALRNVRAARAPAPPKAARPLCRQWRQPALTLLCAPPPLPSPPPQAVLVSGPACRVKVTTTNMGMNEEVGSCVVAMLRPEVCENVSLQTAMGYQKGGSVTFSAEPLAAGGKPSIVHLSGFLMEDDARGGDDEVRAVAPLSARGGPPPRVAVSAAHLPRPHQPAHAPKQDDEDDEDEDDEDEDDEDGQDEEDECVCARVRARACALSHPHPPCFTRLLHTHTHTHTHTLPRFPQRG